MKQLLNLTIAFGLSILFTGTGYSKTETCECKVRAGHTVLTAKTKEGDDISIRIPQKPISGDHRKTTDLFVCSHKDVTTSDADLWMLMDNGHEHGSAPLKVKSTSNTCTHYTNANFIYMKGKWFVRTFAERKNKERVWFEVAVSKP